MNNMMMGGGGGASAYSKNPSNNNIDGAPYNVWPYTMSYHSLFHLY